VRVNEKELRGRDLNGGEIFRKPGFIIRDQNLFFSKKCNC